MDELSIDTLSAGTHEQLSELLRRHGWETDGLDTEDLREEFAQLLQEELSPSLYDSQTGGFIRPARTDEILDSAMAGPEGHFLAGGRSCYVAE